MVKTLSVDWLAQSSLDTPVVQPQIRTHRPHVPCSVQPRPPTSYDRVYLQPKVKVTRVERAEPAGGTLPRSCSSPSFSENSGYSSGYDSEAAASVDDAHDAEKEGAQRRVRTKFTPDQIDKLEKIFCKNKYLDAGHRMKTARKLNLSETQVRTWFQNRRMKLKREVQEMRADFLVPPMIFPAAPPLQLHHYDALRLPFHPHPVQQHVFPWQHFY